MGFNDAAMHYFENVVGVGVFQRIDGVECFSPLSDYWFWRIRLGILVKRGLVQKRVFGSIWKSCRHMPSYGIAQAHADAAHWANTQIGKMVGVV